MPLPPQLMIEGGVIAVYLLLLIAVGWVFRRLNRNTGDYFRSGGRATWWLVGMSAFMSSFSAWTFTGAAGAAYQYGWSVYAVYLGNAVGYLLNALFFAPWARQTRAITVPGVIRARFGESTRAFYALAGVLITLLYASMALYGLGVFSSSVFGLSATGLIVVLGTVVTLYSTFGGSWAVLATDFLQGVILVPITLLLAVLCLVKVGGVSGLLREISTQGLQAQFAFVKTGAQSGGFTFGWIAAVIAQNAVVWNSLGSSMRYFPVKDGAAARKAALLGASLFLVGPWFWLIPPITARLRFAAAVAAMPFGKPAETSYAVASFHLLSPGLVGVMAVAIFAASMSMMGPGLNGNAGVIIYDLYPLLCRLRGRIPRDPADMLFASRLATTGLGLGSMALALVLARLPGATLFDLMLNVGALCALPLAVPLTVGLFVRTSPPWAALFTALGTLVVSLAGFLFHPLTSGPWNYQTRVAVNLAVGLGLYLATLPFWSRATASYRHQVAEFFATMHRPVDFATEVGQANDGQQLRFIGTFALIIGLFVLSLVLLPGSGDWATCSVGAAIALIGLGLLQAGRRS